MDNDEIPTIGTYRGVPLEDQQSDARLALVRREIDHVLGLTDARELADWATDSWHSPESRQLAVAMAESLWTMASENRNNRPSIDLDLLRASTAGLGSRRWRCPTHFCSDLDHDENAVPRDEPLSLE
jgi:hypothetical protein